MDRAQDFILEVPLGRSKLKFFFDDALGNKLETVTQMMVVFCHIASHSHFDVCREIITTARIHDGDADLKDEEPYNHDKNDDANNVRAEDESENEDNDKGQER